MSVRNERDNFRIFFCLESGGGVPSTVHTDAPIYNVFADFRKIDNKMTALC